MIVTGGARAGWMQVTWPLATLSASPAELTVAGSFVGRHRFSPTDVVALEPYRLTPLSGRGVRIVHARTDCPSTIIFWHSGGPDRLIAEIRAAGFVPSAPSAAASGWSGMPVKWSVLVSTVVIWNALFVADGYLVWREPKPPGPFVMLAVAVVLFAATSIKLSPAVQAFVLKPGHSVQEIAWALSLLQLMSAAMLVIRAILVLVE